MIRPKVRPKTPLKLGSKYTKIHTYYYIHIVFYSARIWVTAPFRQYILNYLTVVTTSVSEGAQFGLVLLSALPPASPAFSWATPAATCGTHSRHRTRPRRSDPRWRPPCKKRSRLPSRFQVRRPSVIIEEGGGNGSSVKKRPVFSKLNYNWCLASFS